MADANHSAIWFTSFCKPIQGSFNSGSLFTGLNEHGYNPPDGFCYDWVCEGDDPIMDDPRLNDYNVDDVIRRFKAAAEDQRKHFQGNNIMMTMGSDFQYRFVK